MDTRSRSGAAQAGAASRSYPSINDLPDGVLERFLSFLSSKERCAELGCCGGAHDPYVAVTAMAASMFTAAAPPPPLSRLPRRQRAALVCKHFAAASCSPELLRDVDAGEVKGVAAVQSLAAWLLRHGGHVRQVQLSATPRDRGNSAELSAVEAALDSCLEAAAAAGQLVRLAAGSMVTSTGWLGGLPSLRELDLVSYAWSSPLCLTAAISVLTALGSLRLDGHVMVEGGLRLPPSITQLSLSDRRSPRMPEQASRVPARAVHARCVQP